MESNPTRGWRRCSRGVTLGTRRISATNVEENSGAITLQTDSSVFSVSAIYSVLTYTRTCIQCRGTAVGIVTATFKMARLGGQWLAISCYLHTSELPQMLRMCTSMSREVAAEVAKRLPLYLVLTLIDIHETCWHARYPSYFRSVLEQLATAREPQSQEWNAWDWKDLMGMLRVFYEELECEFARHCETRLSQRWRIAHPDEFVMQQATRAVLFIQSVHKHAPFCRRDFVYNVFTSEALCLCHRSHVFVSVSGCGGLVRYCPTCSPNHGAPGT